MAPTAPTMVASISAGVPAKVVPMSFDSSDHCSDSETTCASSEEGCAKSAPPVYELSLAQALSFGGPSSDDSGGVTTSAPPGLSLGGSDDGFSSSPPGLSTPRCERAELSAWATTVFESPPAPKRTALRTGASVFLPAKRVDGEKPIPDSLNESIDRGSLTALMLHNIPKSHSLDMLVDLIIDLGVMKECNFLYLPTKLETQMNFGYAFINMTSSEAAKRVNERYHLYCETEFPSKMFRPVTISKIQGLDANIDRYQTSPIMDPEVPDKFKPAVFMNGRRVPFPLRSQAPGTVRRKKLMAKLGNKETA